MHVVYVVFVGLLLVIEIAIRFANISDGELTHVVQARTATPQAAASVLVCHVSNSNRSFKVSTH